MARAKRTGGWFRLSRLERGLVSLALRVNPRFESVSLVRALVSVLKRLKEVSHPLYEQLIKGREIARLFSEVASRWGHPHSESWRDDKAYALHLGRLFAGARRPW